jgi:dTDP-4-dehydrorhamnose 3,5-epimerase
MEIINLSIPGLQLIKLKPIPDERGFFKEFYQQPRYHREGIETVFLQDNFSYSKKGVLRGMHFQSFPGQAKLVSVIQGKIFDVAVDIRKNSPTFGKWEGIYLDAGSHEQFFIPEGFAHGFYVVSDKGALVHYKVSSLYHQETEKSFRFDDPTFAITWPAEQPILSVRDQNAPFFNDLGYI